MPHVLTLVKRRSGTRSSNDLGERETLTFSTRQAAEDRMAESLAMGGYEAAWISGPGSKPRLDNECFDAFEGTVEEFAMARRRARKKAIFQSTAIRKGASVEKQITSFNAHAKRRVNSIRPAVMGRMVKLRNGPTGKIVGVENGGHAQSKRTLSQLYMITLELRPGVRVETSVKRIPKPIEV